MRKHACLLTLALLAACSLSPEPDYYALASVPGAAAPDIDYAIKIQRPSLAAYLDRPDFVEQDSDTGVEIDESRRWAEPLDTMFERVLLQDLQQRLPSARLFSEDSGISVSPRVIITFDIQSFNRIAGGKVVLEGQLDLRDTGAPQPVPVQHVRFVADSGALAGDMSGLVGQLADAIVTILHKQEVRSQENGQQNFLSP